MKKERIWGCDFIRIFSAGGVIICHVYDEISIRGVSLNQYWGGIYANGNYGWLFVTLFFILSGAMLYFNDSAIDRDNIKKYYYKRWKGIFPMFYFAWLYFYIQKVIENGNIFYGGNPLRLLWTVAGLDGYMSFKTATYYILGEWFLGAIVIIYIIYPMFLWLYKRNKIITTVSLLAIFLLVEYYNISIQTGPFRSISSCLLSFLGGIILISNRKLLNNAKLFATSLLISIILLAVKIPLFNNANILTHILGMTLFITLYNIGEIIMKVKFIKKAVLFGSQISYPIFLLQHIIIIQIARSIALRYSAIVSGGKYVALLLGTFCVIILQAWILQQANKGIIKSNIFISFEKRVLGEKN